MRIKLDVKFSSKMFKFRKGCNEPIFTDDAQGKIGSEDLEEKCREQVIDDAKGQVETCMQRLVNGFHFPPKRNEQKKGTKG